MDTALEFEDHTITRLGSNSSFTFDSDKREFHLKKGLLLFDMPKNAGGGKIITPSTTAAIEGTAGVVSYRTTPKIICLAGVINVLNPNGQLMARVMPGQLFIVGVTKWPVNFLLNGAKSGKLMQNSLPNNKQEFDQSNKIQLNQIQTGQLIVTPLVMVGEKLNVAVQTITTAPKTLAAAGVQTLTAQPNTQLIQAPVQNANEPITLSGGVGMLSANFSLAANNQLNMALTDLGFSSGLLNAGRASTLITPSTPTFSIVSNPAANLIAPGSLGGNINVPQALIIGSQGNINSAVNYIASPALTFGSATLVGGTLTSGTLGGNSINIINSAGIQAQQGFLILQNTGINSSALTGDPSGTAGARGPPARSGRSGSALTGDPSGTAGTTTPSDLFSPFVQPTLFSPGVGLQDCYVSTYASDILRMNNSQLRWQSGDPNTYGPNTVSFHAGHGPISNPTDPPNCGELTVNGSQFSVGYGMRGSSFQGGSLSLTGDSSVSLHATTAGLTILNTDGPVGGSAGVGGSTTITSGGIDTANGSVTIDATADAVHYVELSAQDSATALNTLGGNVNIVGADHSGTKTIQISADQNSTTATGTGAGAINIAALQAIQIINAQLSANAQAGSAYAGGFVRLQAPVINVQNTFIYANGGSSGIAGRIEIGGMVSTSVSILNSTLTTGGFSSGLVPAAGASYNTSGIYISGSSVNLAGTALNPGPTSVAHIYTDQLVNPPASGGYQVQPLASAPR